MRKKLGPLVPRWQQVADILRDEILSGRHKPGQPLPSEQILSEEFGVARPTIRLGIAALVAEGLLTVRRPYGTIDRDPLAPPAHTWRRGLAVIAGRYTDADTD